MKKILIVVLVIITTSVLSIIVFSFVTGDESDSPDAVIHTTLFSDILGEERELNIHLPWDYDSLQRYPVLYVLDGGTQDDIMASTFDALTAAGYSPKTIVVGIPNLSTEHRERNLTPPFMRTDNDDLNSPFGEGDKFIAFMESELFPFMEKHYRTSTIRMISGNSRGGLFAMYSLLYKPDLFKARFCFSTPFWRQDNILASKVDQLLNVTDTLNTFLYLSAGEKETDNIKNGLRKMTRTIQEKYPVGFVLHSELTPRAIHQNNAARSAAAAIARWSEYYKTLNPMLTE